MGEEVTEKCLDTYYASLLDTADSFSNLDDEDTSTNEDKVNANPANEADFGVIPNVGIEITVDEI